MTIFCIQDDNIKTRMIDLVWLVPLSPLIGFIIIGLGRNNISKKSAGIFGCITVFASFLISCGIFGDLYTATKLAPAQSSFIVPLFDWINAGSLNIPFSFLVDPLSVLMLLIVTGIGFLIHVYSIGYMHHDEGFAKFFLTSTYSCFLCCCWCLAPIM